MKHASFPLDNIISSPGNIVKLTNKQSQGIDFRPPQNNMHFVLSAGVCIIAACVSVDTWSVRITPSQLPKLNSCDLWMTLCDLAFVTTCVECDVTLIRPNGWIFNTRWKPYRTVSDHRQQYLPQASVIHLKHQSRYRWRFIMRSLTSFYYIVGITSATKCDYAMWGWKAEPWLFVLIV